MKFKDNVNYVILTNNNDKNFIAKLSLFQVLDIMDFEKLKNILEMFPSKRVVFNESLSILTEKEKKIIYELLDKQNIFYINVTSNVEDVLNGDYIIIFDGDTKILEGDKDLVLKNDKLLRKTCFGVPFVVDLSNKLMYYDILNKVYFDMNILLEDLWN